MLKRLKLTNFYCHKEFEAEFHPGINCIVGKNGSGKSAQLNAIYGALTNSYDHPDGMTGTIRQGSSSAKIELETDELSLAREISPDKNKHLLTVGNETFRSAKDIENILATRFGIVKSILDRFVFIRQGTFTSILGLTAADRAKMLAHLSGSAYFETLWKRLADEMKLHENALAGTPTFDEYAVQTQVETLGAEIMKLKEDHAKISSELAALDKVTCTQKLDMKQRLSSAVLAAQKYEADIHRLSAELKQIDEIVFKHNAEYTAVDNQLNSVKLSEQELADLEAFNAYTVEYRRINDIETELDALRLRVNDWDRAEMMSTNIKLNEQIQSLSDRQSKLKMQLKIAENTSKNQDCEVCGAPPSAQFKGNPAIISNTLSKISDERSLLEQKLNGNIQIIHNNDSICSRIRELEHKIATHQVTKIKDNLEYYQQLEARYKQELQIREQLERAKIALTTANNNRNNVNQSLDTVKAYFDNDRPLIQQSQQIEADAQQAQKTLDRINTLEIEIVTLDTMLREKTSHYETLSALLKQVAQKQKQKRLQKYMDLLTEVRSMAHRNNIPHIISKKFLMQLIININDYLAQFEAPFKAIVGDDLGFRAEMDSGAMVPATVLSGGQKCMLAMAFWLSVFQTNAGQTGLLVLDEPGDGLDDSNRRIFNQVLAKVDEIFKRQGQQLLLVTHDTNIIGNFHTICV